MENKDVEIIVRLSTREYDCIQKLSAELDLDHNKVLIQALRLYDMTHNRSANLLYGKLCNPSSLLLDNGWLI